MPEPDVRSGSSLGKSFDLRAYRCTDTQGAASDVSVHVGRDLKLLSSEQVWQGAHRFNDLSIAGKLYAGRRESLEVTDLQTTQNVTFGVCERLSLLQAKVESYISALGIIY